VTVFRHLGRASFRYFDFVRIGGGAGCGRSHGSISAGDVGRNSYGPGGLTEPLGLRQPVVSNRKGVVARGMW